MSTFHNILTPDDDLQAVLDHSSPGDFIQLSEGDFRLKCTVFVPSLTIRGADMDKTRIIWDDYANKIHEDGKEYNTFRTWTMAVCADHITMEDLAVVNDSLHPETKGQEVALTVYADDFHMKHCRLTSTQDTLFLGPLPKDLIERYDGFLPDHLRRDISCRQYFEECLILCDARDIGYAAAPAHALEQTEGFLFKNCRFTAEPGVTDGSIYLARPWRDYGLSRFENCTYGPHISPLGFDKWNDTNRDRTARFYETPAVEGRVKWVKK